MGNSTSVKPLRAVHSTNIVLNEEGISIIEEVEKKILNFLARYPNQSFKQRELAHRLSLQSDDEYRMLKDAIHQLTESKRIRRERHGKIGHLHTSQHLVGTVEIKKQGLGFVAVEGTGERVFIAPRFLGTAMHGDKVEVSLFAQPKKKKDDGSLPEGEITKVLERARSNIVGTLERSKGAYVVVPDDRRMGTDVFVEKEALAGAQPGNKVLVEIESWGVSHFNPQGRVIQVLGRAGEISAELLSVFHEYQLPLGFPPDVTKEAETIPAEIPQSEIARRMDVREKVCVTIDPEDAKDFDDAVSFELMDDGTIYLGVHIADVSYYVTEGSALDREALRRGTSVYFPNAVIPMLPEKLSNDLCSLRPNEDRLAYSVFMRMTPQGVVKDYDIRETVIRSKRRFTYEEVQEILDGKNRKTRADDFVDVLHAMHTLSLTLTKKRMKEGSIDFDSPEAKFRYDEEGKPIEIIKKIRLDSHRLVEEFMLAANRTVGRHIGLVKKESHSKPFLYRIHDMPLPERMQQLSLFVAQFGYKLHLDGGVSSKALQRLLEQVRGTEVENVINEVALRSMAKAVYSEKNIGHYGLAFDYYAHFTSPIRRYPDLFIHRLLKDYVRGVSLERVHELGQLLPAVAQQTSDRERVAMEAERAGIKVMQVEYMKRHLGDELHGIISGVTHYGFFVEVNDLLVEGMVHVRDMDDDYYVYDEKKYALIGRETGKQYRLGDAVHVKVMRVNPEEREIDFSLVGEEHRSGKRARRR